MVSHGVPSNKNTRFYSKHEYSVCATDGAVRQTREDGSITDLEKGRCSVAFRNVRDAERRGVVTVLYPVPSCFTDAMVAPKAGLRT